MNNSYDGWHVSPITNCHWQAWKHETLMKDNLESANAAWDWIDSYLNPIKIIGFKTKAKVR